MAELWTSLVQSYEDLMEQGDPRIKHFPLMASPFPALAICITYVTFVKYLGPKLMANRKPFNLRNVLLAYNFSVVVFCVILFYKGCIRGWFTTYSFKCQPVDYSDSVDGIGMMYVSYFYWFSKIIELLDTVFFVLRKKDNQVTNLHVFHHSLMTIGLWWGVKFAPGGHGTFMGFVNTFVHIVMYSYYFLAALGPHMTPYLWWKKYLTTFQMVQFAICFVHAFQLFFRECDYNRIWLAPILINSVLFLYLFGAFYRRSYTDNKHSEGKRKKSFDDSSRKKLKEGRMSTGG